MDVTGIGGALPGRFADRELSRRKLELFLQEAREDVVARVSRADTAAVCPGYDRKPGTLKAEQIGREAVA